MKPSGSHKCSDWGKAVQYACSKVEQQRDLWQEMGDVKDYDGARYLRMILGDDLLPTRARPATRWINELGGRYRAACLEIIKRDINKRCPGLQPGVIGWIYERTFAVVGLERVHRDGNDLRPQENLTLAAIREIELKLPESACADPISTPSELYCVDAFDILD